MRAINALKLLKERALKLSNMSDNNWNVMLRHEWPLTFITYFVEQRHGNFINCLCQAKTSDCTTCPLAEYWTSFRTSKDNDYSPCAKSDKSVYSLIVNVKEHKNRKTFRNACLSLACACEQRLSELL
jgi:hypothetical protein